MLIDSHSHLNFSAYKDDFEDVIHRSLDNNVWMINVGSQYSTSKRAVEIAKNYEKGVFAAVGLHPIYAEEKFNYEKFKKLAELPKVVSIGEIGLDYKPEYSLFKEKQKTLLCQQLDLAKEVNLPVIFHCRMGHDDLISLLRGRVALRGVIHCLTGTWEQAQEYMEMGLYLGFNGIIFKFDLDGIIKKTPLERILIETDCPYLTPPQEREKRNEPIFVKYIVQQIAKIKKLSYEEVAEITAKNAINLFKI